MLIEKLLMSKKLTLMINLDRTLLHTTADHVVGIECHESLNRWGSEDLGWRLTKIRPYTKQFLHSMSQLFELRICTNAPRSYAEKMAQLLDEDGLLFGKRIHSCDDLEENKRHSKTGHLTNLFPGGKHTVIIVDYKKDKWNSTTNLIRVKPYKFFFRGSDNKMTVPIFDADDCLLHLETRLRQIHANFFASYEPSSNLPLPNIKKMVARLKRKSNRRNKFQRGLQMKRM